MTHGIDTDFLVAVEIRGHPFHKNAVALLEGLLEGGHDFAMAPQLLAEFLHVVTDAKRNLEPLPMAEAMKRAAHWWQSEETLRVFPGQAAAEDFLGWIPEHRLGRKRMLDTMLAATYRQAGIRKLITNNDTDYRVFGIFEIVTFRG